MQMGWMEWKVSWWYKTIYQGEKAEETLLVLFWYLSTSGMKKEKENGETAKM